MAEPVYTEHLAPDGSLCACAGGEANFHGHWPRECGEHRTVGEHRAWCYDCTEWCYPRIEAACNGCELPALRARLAEAEAELDGAREALTHLQVIADQRETDRALAVAAVQPLAARLAEVEAERDGLRHRLDIERGAHRGARARLAAVLALCEDSTFNMVSAIEVRDAARGEDDRG